MGSNAMIARRSHSETGRFLYRWEPPDLALRGPPSADAARGILEQLKQPEACHAD